METTQNFIRGNKQKIPEARKIPIIVSLPISQEGSKLGEQQFTGKVGAPAPNPILLDWVTHRKFELDRWI